jgi:enterochelin esterase-like enzyme
MSNRPSIESPRMEILNEALERGDTGALESFWGEMRERGTPLIEPIEGNEESSLVTFVWRATEPVVAVGVISLIAGRQDNHLTQLLDTDVWYRSWPVANDVRATYQFFPQTGAAPAEGGGALARFADYVHDPLNPKTYVFEKDEEDPDGFELTRSVLETPNVTPQPLNEPRDGVTAGTVEMHRLRSGTLGNERRVWVYTPAGYDPDRPEPYDVLVLFDGTGFVKMSPFTTILDNLVASGDVPPLVAVMPCSISQTARFKELLLHDPFNGFLANELIPWAHDAYHLAGDPDRVVAGGASAGGLAAAYAAFEHPELFGNVLSLSGAFVFSPGMLGPGWNGEHEWLARRIAASETKPIRFHLSAGTLETNSLRDLGGGPNLVLANRHLRTVLEAKGYPVWLHEFPGGHDMISWQGVIPKGLTTLLGWPSRSAGILRA